MTAITVFMPPHRFLSNFWPCPPSLIYLPDEQAPELWYRTTEHAYQASKFPPSCRALFHQLEQAGKAKALGKGAGGVDWRKKNKDIMLHLLRLKYSEPYLRTLLLRTGDAELTEGNWWHDNFWGSCSCERCVNIVGENHLGKLTMLVRAEIKCQIPTS